MEVGQRAPAPVTSEVFPEPAPLRRGGAAATYVGAVTVEGDEVPVSEVEGVVALSSPPCGIPEVAEVTLRIRRFVLVVAGGRPGAALESAPGRSVAVGELLGRAVLVGLVAQGKDRAANTA